MGRREKRREKSRAWIAPTALVLFLAFSGVTVYTSNRCLEVEEFSLVFPELPAAFDGFTIAHLSDLHGVSFDSFKPDALLSLREIAPDIIVITGDAVDSKGDISWVYGTMAELVEIAPVYFVTGNHEFGTRRFSDIEKDLKRAGVIVLRNQSAGIRRGEDEILIVGIEDPLGPAEMLPMEEVIGLVRKKNSAFFITLNHRYERFDEYVRLGLPLVFTGHAHGGLIRLPGTDGLVGPGRKIFPKRTSGVYTEGETTMVTSRGIGNAGVTFRIWSYPHIPVVRLYRTT